MRPKSLEIAYHDRGSVAAQWWKAVFLAPPWAFFVIPVVGIPFALVGVGAVNIGLVAVLLALVAYFIEGLRRRKIRIGERYISLGWRRWPLDSLESIGFEYAEERLVPVSLLLRFAGRRSCRFKFSRLKVDQLEQFLRVVERTVPQCRLDPLLGALLKSRKTARRVDMRTDGRLPIRNSIRRLFQDVNTTVSTNSEAWQVAGPIMVLILCAPVWTYVVASLYKVWSMALLAALQHKSVYSLSYFKLAAEEGVYQVSAALYKAMALPIEHGAKVVGYTMAHPIAGAVSALVIVYLGYRLLKSASWASNLQVDDSGVTLELNFLGVRLSLGRIPWTDLVSASLVKGRGTKAEHWLVRLHRASGDPMDIEMQALAAEDRIYLLGAIQKMAGHCHIDPALSENLMPKQERSYTELWLQSLASPEDRRNLEPLVPGQLLGDGRYEVIRRLGIGGQGLTYLCIDHSATLGERRVEVVLKETVLPLFADRTVREQAVERFDHEARLLASLDSSRIVRLLDVFTEDHRGYLVLEHIEGRTLRLLVEQEGPLPEEQLEELTCQMCEILDYLHGRGIVHRDFTPENLILTDKRHLKLIDFNVAQLTESGATGTVVGKHAYVPPEQFRGKATTQSDIYALGATLFYLCSGRDPEPISQSGVRSLRPELSARIDLIVQSCTQLQCEKRLRTAQEVRRMLQSGVDGDAAGCTISLGSREKDLMTEAGG